MATLLSLYFVEPVLRQARWISDATGLTKVGLTANESNLPACNMIATDNLSMDEKNTQSSTINTEQRRNQDCSRCSANYTRSYFQQDQSALDLDNRAIKDSHSCSCTRQSHASTTTSSLPSTSLLTNSPRPDGDLEPTIPSTTNTATLVTSQALQNAPNFAHHSSTIHNQDISPTQSAKSSDILITDFNLHPPSTTSTLLPPPRTIGTEQRPQTIHRTRSLGAIFALSIYSDRDWSSCARHVSNASLLDELRHPMNHSNMSSPDETRDRTRGSDAPVRTSSETNLFRQHLRTRRNSWTQSSNPRNGPRRPPLLDHYTDSLIIAPEDNSRTKQDEDIISRESELRRKIQEICTLSITNEEKAKRIHYVMNEQYLSRTEAKFRKKTLDGDSALVRHRSSDSSRSDISSSGSNIDLELYTKFNVMPADLVPTRRPRRHSEETIRQGNELTMTPVTNSTNAAGNSTPPEIEFELGCDHYKRNVKIQCFECKSWWNCRYCHDQTEPGHALPRHKTENMLCMLCQTPGPAGQYCEHCGEQAAYYFCEICKLWDDDLTKRIYHCTDCGICRLGEGLGKDFQHCKRCNVCIPFQQFAWHKCLERATDCDCPICGDYMFTSKAPIVSMPCGHYLHRTCYNEYMLNSYQCPICKKSARNMESQWRKMEEEIARQPMPMNLRNVTADVRCNDCGGKSRVSYHWLGNKCGLCDSFNTTEIEVHRDGGFTTATTPSPPRGNWRTTRSVPQRTVRRYFDDDEVILEAQRSGILGEVANVESLLALPASARELLATMTRNLSPIRRYLNNGQATSPTGRLSEAVAGVVSGRIRSWNLSEPDNAQARNGATLVQGNEQPHVDEDFDDNEEDEDDDDYDSSEDEEGYLYDDDDDDSDGSGLDALDVELIGHR